MRCGLASLRGACIWRAYTGGGVALLLNHRLHSVNPPGSGRGLPGTPAGCASIPTEPRRKTRFPPLRASA